MLKDQIPNRDRRQRRHHSQVRSSPWTTLGNGVKCHQNADGHSPPALTLAHRFYPRRRGTPRKRLGSKCHKNPNAKIVTPDCANGARLYGAGGWGIWGRNWLSWMPGWRWSARGRRFHTWPEKMLSPAGEGVYELTSGGAETAIRHRSSGPITIGGGTIGFRPKPRGLRRARQTAPQNPGDPKRRTVPQFPRDRGRFHQPIRFRDCSYPSLIGAA